MENNHLTVNILGVSLTLKSKESPEYLTKITRYFQNKIEEARETLSTEDPLKILILAGLNISDELLKERNKQIKYIESEVDPADLEDFTERMINKIDESLMEH